MRLRNFHYGQYCNERLTLEDRELFSTAMERFASDLQLARIHCPDTESTGLFVAFERDGEGPVVILGIMKMRMADNHPIVETVVLAPEIVKGDSFSLSKLILNGMISCVCEVVQNDRRNDSKRLLIRAKQSQALAIATWIQDDPNMVKIQSATYVCYEPRRASSWSAFHRDRMPCWSDFLGQIPSDPIPPWRKEGDGRLEW